MLTFVPIHNVEASKQIYFIVFHHFTTLSFMKYHQIEFPQDLALDLDDFKAMDYYAVENYNLPIELMMENAGLQLANLIASFTKKEQIVLIGIGNGNNGGGGLVAARRLAAWGFSVHLDLITDITKELPKTQLKRALAFGATTTIPEKIDIWVDAYLGFSQRFPLPDKYNERIIEANNSSALRITLDVPTGFDGNMKYEYFHCDIIITLAASKKILYKLPKEVDIYIADLGIPAVVYKKFNSNPPPFNDDNIIKIIR